MLKIKRFIFNAFQENTYVFYANNGDCAIVDPGCISPNEENVLIDFISKNNLTPKHLLLTHGHIDHILGVKFCSEKFKLSVAGNESDNFLLDNSKSYGSVYGFNIEQPPLITKFYNDGDILNIGDEEVRISHVPGHSPGSLAYYSESSKWVIVGDVLFRESIGRTDLPGGNLDTLLSSIRKKLFTLPPETVVYSGHMQETTISHEISNNPFLDINQFPHE